MRDGFVVASDRRDDGTTRLLGRVGGQSVAYAIPGVVGAAIGVVALPLYTRWLSPTEYGYLSVSLATGRLAFALFHLGVFAALARLAFDRDDGRAREALVGTVLVFVLLWGGGLGLGAILLLWSAPGVAAPWATLLSIAVANAFLLLVPQLTLTLFTIRGQAWHHATASTVQVLVTAGLALTLAARMGGAEGALLGTATASACLFVVHLVHLGWARFPPLGWARFPPLGRRWRPTLSRVALTRCLAYGLPVQVATVGWWALGAADRIALTWLSSAGAAGIYASAAALVASLSFVALAFNQAWTIQVFRVAATEPERLARLVARGTTYFVLALAFLTALLLGYAEPLARWLVGPKFQEARGILPLVAVSAFVAGLYFVPSRTLFERRRHGVLGAILAVAIGVEVVGLLILVPSFGPGGAALATLAGNAVAVVLTYHSSERLMSVPYEWPRLAGIGTALAVSLALVVALRLAGVAATMLTGSVVALAFPATVWAAGVATVEERAWLRRAVGARSLG